MLKILATFALIINAFLVMRVKLFFLFCLLCGGIAAQKSATINSVWHESDVTRDGKKGLLIHSDFNVIGMKGYKVQCIISFYDANYNKLKTTYPGYCTTSNTACTHDRDEVTFENSRYSDWPLFIPYEALNLPAGKKTYYYKVFVRDENYNTLKSSQYYAFTASGKNITRLADGTSVEEIENSDGTTTRITRKVCFSCRGTKTCGSCRGAGGSTTVPRNSVYWRMCEICSGSGICSRCDKNGMTTTYMTVNNKTGNYEFVGYNGAYYDQGHVSKFSSSSNNSEGSSGSTLKNHTCSTCNGSGKMCKDVPLTLGDIYYCSFCGHNGYGKHMQVRCIPCNGKGSYRY